MRYSKTTVSIVSDQQDGSSVLFLSTLWIRVSIKEAGVKQRAYYVFCYSAFQATSQVKQEFGRL